MSLIHYWPLDEASGAAAVDVISGVSADVVNNPAVVPGEFGNARDFSQGAGNAGALTLRPTAPSAATIDNFTVVCAIKQGVNTSTFQINSQFWYNAQDGIDLYYLSLSNSIDVDFYAGGVYLGYLDSPLNLSDGLWHWIVVRVADGVCSLHVDGVMASSAPMAAKLAPAAANSLFGAYSIGGGAFCDTVADELAIFDHALTDEEIASLGTASIGELFGPEPFIPPEFPTRIYYTAELRKSGSAPLRLPISSWQATLQAPLGELVLSTSRTSYLQCVVPAAEQHIDNITAMGLGSTLTVIRGALLPDGSTTELDMATVPLQQMPYQRGPQRSTVTLSGYGVINFPVIDPDAPPAGSVRTLTGVQTISVDTSGVRVRAQIDWLLRPRMIAIADGSQFQVAYINYYVNATQEFMDVGSRPL